MASSSRSSALPAAASHRRLGCWAGLEHISAGDMLFGERRVNDLPPKDRDIAMVFENYALYPHKTVRDNIANALVCAAPTGRPSSAR